MKITEVRLGRISVPLHTPFKTALRTVSSVEDVIVELRTDDGRMRVERVSDAVFNPSRMSRKSSMIVSVC